MKYTHFLRWALFGGVAAVFFIPFLIADGSILPNMFFPFITGKNFIFRLLIELLLGVYILLALREPQYRPRASWVLWTTLAFVVWMAVATVFSVDPTKSFWSNFERMEGYITVLHLFAFFLIAGAVAAQNWWERLFQVSIASGAIMGCYGVLQLMGVLAISTQSGARVDTTFGNAAYLAVFMLFNIFLTLFMLVRLSAQTGQRRSTLAQVLYGLALVVQCITLFETQTRGALLGLLGGLVVAGIYIAWRATALQWRPLRKIAIGGLGIVVLVVVAFFALRSTSIVQKSPTLQRLASISLNDRTTQARFQIWNMAYHGFLDRPALGWGQENFSYVFNRYYQPSMYTQEQWFDRAHNQFLDWLIAGGLPAFLLYLALFLLSVWAIVRSEVLSVPEQAVLLGLLAGYAFNNLFVFDDLMSSVYFFVVLAFLHSLSRRPLPGWMFLSKPVNDKVIAVVAPGLAVVILMGAWILNAPGIVRAQNMVQAITTQVGVPNGQGGLMAAPKDPKLNLAEFTTTLDRGVWPGTPLGGQEVMEQLMQFASGVSRSTTLDPSLRQDILALAVNTGKTTMAHRPDDARLELFMGSLYDTFGQYADGLPYLQSALQHSPFKQQIMFELAVAHLNLNDGPAALSVLKTAFEEAPSYNDARILYAVGLLYTDHTSEADALLQEGFGTTLVDDARLLQVYGNTKRYDRVIGIWQKRAKDNPDDAKVHIGLATAYFAAGDKANTIAELKRAGQLDASVAAQVQSVITQIQNGTLKPAQ